MLSDWLRQQLRNPQVYKFPVTDVTELVSPDEKMIDYLARALLLNHADPQRIQDEFIERIKDAEDSSLDTLKRYLENNIFPGEEKTIVRVGNFGEVLASTILVDFENFWFPIYKLRFREKKDWAMRQTDLCFIKQIDGGKLLVCYGEVKTVSGPRDKNIAIEGHKSLVLGEAKDMISEPDILRFTVGILYEAQRFSEATLISEIGRRAIKYDKRHDLFIIHSKEQWTDEILDRLENYPLDTRLVGFSTRIVLISGLRQLIDTVYCRCPTVAKSLIDSMDKQEYLQNANNSVGALIRDRQFQKDLAQVQARSIQEELSSVQLDINYTFDAREVWQRCDYIFSNSALILREENELQENANKRKALMDYLKTTAQSFEFLSKFSNKGDREILLINAAICYHITGYHANAQCLAKIAEKDFLPYEEQQESYSNLDTRLAWIFRRALLSFLRRDIVNLQRGTQQAISFILAQLESLVSDTEQEQIISNIDNLYGHLFFQKSLFNFTQYCIQGDLDHLKAAQRNTEKCYRYFQQVRDTRFGVITSELRTLLKLFEDQSTWSNIGRYGESLIQSPIWRTYLRNLAREKSIVEFWTSQLKALQGELLTSEDSFIIQMPTSAGKTFIAELAVLATLTSPSEKRCLYIAPYRALVNEIEDKLVDTLQPLGYRVSNLAGGFEFDGLEDFLAVKSHVLVTTPEKADLLFRTHPEYFENVSTIVIDEGHVIDEGVPSQKEIDKGKTLSEVLAQRGTLGRGTLLEILISRLKRKLPQAHFLFLSAVMPEVNGDDFVNWLSRNSEKPLKIERSERPSRQTIVTFKWMTVTSEEKGGCNGRLQYFNPDGSSTYVNYFLQRELYYTGEYTRNGGLHTINWPNIENKVQTTAMLVIKFASNGPVLVFCAMPSQVRNVVENIIKSLKYFEADERTVYDGLKYVENPNLESFDLAKEWLGNDHPLTRGLHYGVGLHYGPLPDPVRQAIEDDFRDGNVSVLVSTNTLGQGVNLPVKTAIIYSLERKYTDLKDKKVKVETVKKRDFWNMCGRAGRAGKETEGQIVFVAPSPHDTKLFNEFRHEDNIEPVESPLYKLLRALVEKRISQDLLIDYLDAHVLALLAEEVVNTEDETAISNFLKTSLVGVQALRNNLSLIPLVSAIKHTAVRINQEVPDQALRATFASTGLQVKSCKTLEDAVDLFLALHSEEISEDENRNPYLDEELLEHAFEACQHIPEMQLAKGAKAPKPKDELKLVKDWIKGKPINEIRSMSWTSEQEDEFGNYIADRVIYKLPWGFNGFLRILAFKLQKKYDELPLGWQCLPSMMKFGVNSVFACWISSFGVSSRQLALELARRYPRENGDYIISFFRWLVNLPTEFLFQELSVGSVAEKKRLLQKISRIVADNTQLQFNLQRRFVLESSVQGIPYFNRVDSAFEVQVGDELILEAEPDNQYDPAAIRILFDGRQIGYVQRDKAKIISREMQLGREFQARAKEIIPPLLNYPYPDIVMTIIG